MSYRHEDFNVNIDVFEGPFDLLLSLVLKQELDICEVPMAAIIADYIEHIEERQGFDIELTSEFLVIAATLLEIKSNVVFPMAFGYDEDEELSPEEAQRMLAMRLIEFAKFKRASDRMSAMMDGEEGIHYRFPVLEGIRQQKLPANSQSPAELVSFLTALLRSAPPISISIDHILNITVSVEDQIERIIGLLAATKVLTFSELTHGLHAMEKAISFFAVLELYRTGHLDLRQDAPFGPIHISLCGRRKRAGH